MVQPLFLEEIDDDGVARIILTRAEVHNAFNEDLIAELTKVLQGLEEDKRVRLVVLSAKGKSFSAGADLNWMQRAAGYSKKQNLADAQALAKLMQTLNEFAKPTIAAVQGPAYGGGVGLVACCDIAIAAVSASFCLSEVKLGLIPAVISPYVVDAIGSRAARRYFLTAERFDARQALDLGLVHAVVPLEDLQSATRAVVDALLQGGPSAQGQAKRLIRDVAGRPVDTGLIAQTASRIAELRAGGEAKEGIAAFLEKRRPPWLKEE